MSEQQIEKILNTIGVSSGIILLVLIIGTAFVVYKNYLETEKLKLQIALFKGMLNGSVKADI